MKAARDLHERIGEPNLLVKIPATTEGVPAIEAMIAEGRSINVTLVFSLARYRQVLEAYLLGLETLADRGGDLSTRPQRGVVLREPGRHRGRPAPGGNRYRPRRSRCAAEPPSHKPSSPTSSSGEAHTGDRWERLAEPAAPGRNGRSGHPRRPRTPPTPTPSTSTA